MRQILSHFLWIAQISGKGDKTIILFVGFIGNDKYFHTQK